MLCICLCVVTVINKVKFNSMYNAYATRQVLRYVNDINLIVGTVYFVRHVTVARLKAINPKVKVMVALARTKTEERWIRKMLTTQEMRYAFVQSCIAVLRTNDLDGIDIDFEYAGSEKYSYRFTQLLAVRVCIYTRTHSGNLIVFLDDVSMFR